MKDNGNFPFLANQTGVNSQAYDITANTPIKHTSENYIERTNSQ
jgi:hypothetical protein